jgi:hypothetical protein
MTPTTIPGGRTGPYVLTLCSLASPVSIRPPQSPHLKPFTFFTSRARHADGSVRLHLHMGYFATPEQAQKWAQLMRPRYPSVAVMRAPAEPLAQRGSRVPTLAPAETRGAAPTTGARHPVQEASLTDTQVMKVLVARGADPEDHGPEGREKVSVLRPEDTDTRRILKEAVIRGAPVSFAVQLHRSDEPPQLASLPSLSIFRAYTLYKTAGTRNGRPSHTVRLGFFSDAISAKQVAYYVMSSFASVAVVPISDEERERAAATAIDPSCLGDAVRQRINETLDADRPRPVQSPNAATGVHPQPLPSPARSGSASKRRGQSLEETLEMLAASEIWTNTDSLSETGVRHLKVDIKR